MVNELEDIHPRQREKKDKEGRKKGRETKANNKIRMQGRNNEWSGRKNESDVRIKSDSNTTTKHCFAQSTMILENQFSIW